MKIGADFFPPELAFPVSDYYNYLMNYGVNTVHVPANMRPKPHDFEFSVAVILSQYFQAEVNFVERGPQKTADLEISGQYWEVKSPIGGSPRTIQNNLRAAYKQSRNIVLDLRRCKLHGDRAIGYVKAIVAEHSTNIKKLLVITKSGKIVVIL